MAATDPLEPETAQRRHDLGAREGAQPRHGLHARFEKVELTDSWRAG
jgi:hypothetical protein